MKTSAQPKGNLTFNDFNLLPELVSVLDEIGYETPTPIQEICIPKILTGTDILGQAQTGTGKTGAFALPLLSKLDFSGKQLPQVLVLTPTRELSIQVAEAFQTYARKLPSFHVVPIYGGQPIVQQLAKLDRKPQVVVGTPGRIIDHLNRKSLKLQNLKAIVIDEADEMLKMGFIDDIEWILDNCKQPKQLALFSATMPDRVKSIARKHLVQPDEVKIKSKTVTVEAVDQSYWLVTGLHKLDALTRVLEVEDFEAVIIFVKTKTSSEELAVKLQARGYACSALNGDMNQASRLRTVESLRSGKLDIVIATDVAARGLDVERVTHVLNYDIPHDPESYIHRIGRTGRAGRKGKAILFVAPRERRMLMMIEHLTKQKIEAFRLPAIKDLNAKRFDKLKELILETIKKEDLQSAGLIVQELLTEEDLSPEQLAAAFCFLFQQLSPAHQQRVESAAPVVEPWDAEDHYERRQERGRSRARSSRDSRKSFPRESFQDRRSEKPRGKPSERPSGKSSGKSTGYAGKTGKPIADRRVARKR